MNSKLPNSLSSRNGRNITAENVSFANPSSNVSIEDIRNSNIKDGAKSYLCRKLGYYEEADRYWKTLSDSDKLWAAIRYGSIQEQAYLMKEMKEEEVTKEHNPAPKCDT